MRKPKSGAAALVLLLATTSTDCRSRENEPRFRGGEPAGESAHTLSARDPRLPGIGHVDSELVAELDRATAAEAPQDEGGREADRYRYINEHFITAIGPR